jgi:hypothetical protein
MDKTYLQSKISSIVCRHDSNWRVYHGSTDIDAQILLNDDGTFPYVREVNAKNTPLLALNPEYSITTEAYQVTWVSDNVPDANLRWWLSFDGGDKIPVKFERKELRVMRSHWWIYLTKD